MKEQVIKVVLNGLAGMVTSLIALWFSADGVTSVAAGTATAAWLGTHA